MHIMIHGQHMEVTAALREHIEKRMSKLSRYFDPIADIQFHVSAQRNFKTAEVTVNANGHLIRAEERSDDIRQSVDDVVEKLEGQIRHYKDRLVTRHRRPHRHGMGDHLRELPAESAAGAGDAPEPGDVPLSDLEPDEIVRRKRFALITMPAGEAVLRMQLLGHSFFMFQNEETGSVSVVYERQDGGFGLLEPELER
jgi:putative sigma-54 modulation protein